MMPDDEAMCLYCLAFSFLVILQAVALSADHILLLQKSRGSSPEGVSFLCYGGLPLTPC